MSLISPLTSLAFKCMFTTRLAFFASKMQASSTQKTKDSAGKRLGKLILIKESKDLEERRFIQEILLLGNEVINGILEIIRMLVEIIQFIRRLKVLYIIVHLLGEKENTIQLIFWLNRSPIEKLKSPCHIITTHNYFPKEL